MTPSSLFQSVSKHSKANAEPEDDHEAQLVYGHLSLHDLLIKFNLYEQFASGNQGRLDTPSSAKPLEFQDPTWQEFERLTDALRDRAPFIIRSILVHFNVPYEKTYFMTTTGELVDILFSELIIRALYVDDSATTALESAHADIKALKEFELMYRTTSVGKTFLAQPHPSNRFYEIESLRLEIARITIALELKDILHLMRCVGCFAQSGHSKSELADDLARFLQYQAHYLHLDLTRVLTFARALESANLAK